MEIKGMTPGQLATIIATVSLARYDGNVVPAWGDYDPKLLNAAGTRFRGRIIVKSSKGTGARRSWTGRRMPVACWHVFRDVIREALKQYPDAVFRTAMARYTASNFEDTYPATGYVNIGSMMQPAYMPDLCDCDDSYVEPTLAVTPAQEPESTASNDYSNSGRILAQVLPAIASRVSFPCGCNSRQAPVDSVIIHLNDGDQWTREQIADWLDTLDLDLRFPVPE